LLADRLKRLGKTRFLISYYHIKQKNQKPEDQRKILKKIIELIYDEAIKQKKITASIKGIIKRLEF